MSKTGMVIDKSSVNKVLANLSKIAGNASKIVGTLQELMSYAANVELGVGRNKSKPHMRPAYAMMIVEAVPQIVNVLKRAFYGSPTDIDQKAVEAVAAAIFTMEAHRVNKLRELVYTAEKLAAMRAKGYRGYKLTGNLMQNRKGWVKAIGAAIKKTVQMTPVSGIPQGS